MTCSRRLLQTQRNRNFHADYCVLVIISIFAEFELSFSPGQGSDGSDPFQTKSAPVAHCVENKDRTFVLQLANFLPLTAPICPQLTLWDVHTERFTYGWPHSRHAAARINRFLKRMKFHNETDTCTSTNLYHVEHNRGAFASVRETHSCGISYSLSVFSKTCIQYDFYIRFYFPQLIYMGFPKHCNQISKLMQWAQQ